LAICVPGAVSNIIDQYKIGTIAQAGDVEGIAAAIANLSKSKKTSPDWASALADFDGRNLTSSLAQVFRKVSD